MRRFLLCALLLLILLVLSRRSASIAAPLLPDLPVAVRVLSWSDARSDRDLDWDWDWEWEWEWDGEGLDRRRTDEEFFGHPSPRPRIRREHRSPTAPQAVDGEIRFRLRDRRYESVSLSASFLKWDEEPMRLDEEQGWWEISLPVRRGTHRYVFVVVDEDGRERERSDPANPRRDRREGKRRVSKLVVDRHGEVVRPHRGDETWVDLLGDMGVSYQRVDGFSLLAKPAIQARQRFGPSLHGELGYGLKSDRWSARLTFLQPLTPEGELRMALSAYDRTDFTDQTGVGDVENTLSTLLFREDNRDYYRREGVSFGLEASASDWLRAQVELRSDEVRSLEQIARAAWGGRERFAPNPEVDEGMLRSLGARLRLGDDLNHLRLDYEIADDGLLSTPYEFSMITGSYRTRVRMGRSQYLDLRLKAGTRLSGTLPVQRRYLLGGIGTVRGHPYQSLLVEDPERGSEPAPFGGQRMALANLEYAFGVDDDLLLFLFYDTGMAWESGDAEMRGDELESSVGIGIATGPDDDLRLDLVKTLDEGEGEILVQARIRRMF